MQTSCRTFLSAITTKTPFSSSPLISLHHKSINKTSCTRTNISAYRDCLVDILVELVNIPVKLAGIPAELMDIFTKLVDMSVKLVDMPVKLAGIPAKVI